VAAAAHVAVAVVAAAADTEGDSAVGRVVGVQVEKAAFAGRRAKRQRETAVNDISSHDIES
jgi:hypothetical protein